MFGAPRLVRNLTVTGRRKLPYQNRYVNIEPEFIDLQFVLTGLGITREQLIDVGILVGTDFNPGIKGFGPKKALKAIQEYNTLENVIKEKELELPEFTEVRKIFNEPDVINDYIIKWLPINEDKVLDFLCEEHDFAKERVQNTIDSFQEFKSSVAQRSLEQWF
jgi:flap endonuclease-1